MDALTEIIMSESSDDMKAIRMQILQRIANEVANVTPRMPAPLNITEIGGYYNLLNRMGQEETPRRYGTWHSDGMSRQDSKSMLQV